MKTKVIALALLLFQSAFYCAETAVVVFADDFSGDLSSWNVAQGPNSIVEITNDQELRLKENTGGAAQVLSPIVPARHTISFDFRIPPDGGNSGFATQLRFRDINDNSNSYELRFTNVGTFRNADNEGSGDTFAFAKDLDYRLEFVNTASKTTMRMWRLSDNVLLRTLERARTDSLEEGRFSIRVNSSGGSTINQEIFINNFDVLFFPIPEPGTVAFLFFGGLLLAVRRRLHG